MNAQKFLFVVLFTQFAMSICSSRGATPDDRAFIEAIREHNKNGTQRNFSYEFRERIKQDKNGDLIKAISEDPELNSSIFYNLDAVPEKFAELVIASWLEDDYQWGSRGGMYYSPSTQLDHWLRATIRPEDIVDPPAIQNLYYVLEDKHTRKKMAEILRACYSDEELNSGERSERRAEAWGKIVGIVEQSFPRLLEEDNARRSAAATDPKPKPGQFLEKLKQRNPEHTPIDQASGQANIEKDQWIWYLLAVVVFLGVAGFLLRSRIATRTRRRS